MYRLFIIETWALLTLLYFPSFHVRIRNTPLILTALPKYKDLVEPTIEFIGDLLHLHPLVIQVILSSKNHNKIACVTDAILEESAKEATYCGRSLEVSRPSPEEPARVTLKGTSTMAGSCTTQLAMFHSLLNIFDVSLVDAVQMLSHTPARVARLENIGAIREGNHAGKLEVAFYLYPYRFVDF
jgi:N-acetylglucosamine-6-phosphate deacetylase